MRIYINEEAVEVSNLKLVACPGAFPTPYALEIVTADSYRLMDDIAKIVYEINGVQHTLLNCSRLLVDRTNGTAKYTLVVNSVLTSAGGAIFFEEKK